MTSSPESSTPGPHRGVFRTLIDAASRLLPGHSAPPLQAGLDRINSRLGFGDDPDEPTAQHQPTDITVANTADHARDLYYAPDMDGQPEPGEVVWVWAPSDGAEATLRNRAILVVGHNPYTVLGLLISPNPEHADDDMWLDIGAGEWDEAGRDCWVRLDRVLEVSHLDIRRQGAFFPQRRFERVAAKLRDNFGWT
ncbi:type II toxin-antitoxin system PemK/MazF family toxin [Corynebacterium uberis]|uniref:type II toxin-antitoxin system PemK/MazF family toxin n=1 Tax=Corynebacterium uberis TaxID=2883169 RepID=UPI001D0A034B|nr:type II toxin-antitoxin system PemK/MazF family toxin [Corynebacterium uberis]UDL77483.1 type II toxin-antitoxin system PemK/MazF family toxin [Corynebacterium uberis]